MMKEDTLGIRNSVLLALEPGEAVWRTEKRACGCDELRFWECKAHANLPGEARRLVAGISVDPDMDPAAFRAACESLLASYSDWGWRESWPGHVHGHAVTARANPHARSDLRGR